MTQAQPAGGSAAPPTKKTTAVKKTTAAKKSNGAAETGEKKARAPRKNYGYSPASIIHLTAPGKGEEDKAKKYRGKRGDYYNILVKSDGKTVNEFEAACPEGDAPRGWLRFFVQDGACSLEQVKEAEAKTN